jgi:hypothetical protein
MIGQMDERNRVIGGRYGTGGGKRVLDSFPVEFQRAFYTSY